MGSTSSSTWPRATTASACRKAGRTTRSSAASTRTAGTNPHNVTLALIRTTWTPTSVTRARAKIRGVVYYDWNQNQVKGLGEAGIPSTQVCLFADNAPYDGAKDSTTPIACTTSDSFGNYVFTNQLPGHYIVEQTTPSGLTNTTPIDLQVGLVLTQGAGFSANNNFGVPLDREPGPLHLLRLERQWCAGCKRDRGPDQCPGHGHGNRTPISAAS